MDYSDIVKLRGELQSFEINNYPKSSRMTHDVGRKRLLHELVQAINPEQKKANYVYMLMGLGQSRSGAYAIVTEAYKIIQDNKNTAVTQTRPKTVAADEGNAQPDGADQPATTTPAPRNIQWPDEVKKATAGSVLPPLGDIVTGIWRVGIMGKEGEASKDEYRQPLIRCEANLARYVGKFSRTVLTRAFNDGWNGKDPPFGRLISLKTEAPGFDIPELAGKHASIYLPEEAKLPSWGDERKAQVNRINAMVTEGDEVTVFDEDGKRSTEKNGEVPQFASLIQAADFAKVLGAVAVIIHQQQATSSAASVV